jgi:uncharacterized protein (DUF885 family)
MGVHFAGEPDVCIRPGRPPLERSLGRRQPAAIERRHRHAEDALRQLARINRGKLAPADRLNYDLFQYETQLAVEEFGHRWHLIPLTQREGIQTADELADALRFETVKDYDDWIARCRGLSALADQTIALMREGIRQQRVQPKITMQRVPAQIDKQITATPEASPFYKPFAQFPATIPEPERQRLTGAAKEAIAGRSSRPIGGSRNSS